MRSKAAITLGEFLGQLPAGPVEDRDELERLLAQAWLDLDGSEAEGTEAWKLVSRIEKPVWVPPCLEFHLERHGQTVMGSSRPAVHHWSVDVDTAEAHIIHETQRQIRQMDARLDVKAIANDIAELVAAAADDPRLDWSDDHTRVKLRIGETIPTTNQQTTADRRRRFRSELEPQLTERGWSTVGRYTYEKQR